MRPCRCPPIASSNIGLNSALFSDHADKARYIYVPAGEKLGYTETGVLDFPVGAAMVKHFGFTRADGSLDLIETRLLVKQAWGGKPTLTSGMRTTRRRR